jgi:hypothetical protein
LFWEAGNPEQCYIFGRNSVYKKPAFIFAIWMLYLQRFIKRRLIVYALPSTRSPHLLILVFASTNRISQAAVVAAADFIEQGNDLQSI